MGEVFAGPGSRICSRPVCKSPAVVTLSFDYGRRWAWLDELNHAGDPATYDLCSTHAERFGPPAGWSWEDRRAVTESVDGGTPEGIDPDGIRQPRQPQAVKQRTARQRSMPKQASGPRS